jgi:nitrogen fixation/metabolism regulation signal transduction histidine kinase
MARQVAHEIKNPLTPMKLSVQHLRRAFARTGVPAGRAGDGSAGDEAQARFASLFDRVTSTLIEQIGALARIANEFSTFARLPTRVAEPLNLSAVAKEAVALMEAEDDAVFALDFAEDPLVVSADREELRRLYINLLKNALQAIPADRAGRIEVATARTTPPDGGPSRARTTVTDNGTGIAPAQRDKIFQPNFSTKTSGTGLGLAIARKSVEELGGAIGFETEVGTGTTFWVELPLDEG